MVGCSLLRIYLNPKSAVIIILEEQCLKDESFKKDGDKNEIV